MKTKIFFAVILVTLLLSISPKAFAADDSMSMDDSSPSISPEVSPIITIENKQIQYDLPYPGLLPDNPLYSLKVLRDKIVEFFISDPVKKADYELLQADKRINTSLYLENEKPVHEDLISSTVSKSFNYLEQAVSQTQLAIKQGNTMDAFISHMDIASQKYNSVLLELETKASPALKKDLAGDQKRLDSIRNTIIKMEKK